DVLVQAGMTTTQEVAEQRSRVGVDAVVVAVQEVVGDEAVQALGDRARRPRRRRVDLVLLEAFSAQAGRHPHGSLVCATRVAVARLEELIVEGTLNDLTVSREQVVVYDTTAIEVGGVPECFAEPLD